MSNSPNVLSSSRIAVVGFAHTGQAVARVARQQGTPVVAIDDRPSNEAIGVALELGVELVINPSREQILRFVRDCEFVVVSPGIPPSHPVFEVASDNQLISEIELAYRLATVPIIAVTGTNGKTTVTELVTQMMVHSGWKTTAAGNIGPTLIDAVERTDLDYIVAEVSSFQLALCTTFRPNIGTWLNFAEDHLDWHRSLEEYSASKARIWQEQNAGDVAVVNQDDPVVMAAAATVRSRIVTFGSRDADYTGRDGRFVGPGGVDLGEYTLLARTLPHDIDNGLAALATALEAGATIEGCRQALSSHRVLPHRIELVTRINHIAFYDDSKATTPSAVIAALSAFRSVVLIAGGRNKGLDLGAIGAFVDQRRDLRLRAVVAIGEASDEVRKVFSRHGPVVQAGSMEEAVGAAFELAEQDDAVLLSPGCASFDWYQSYVERGNAFVSAVGRLAERVTTSTDSKVGF